MINFCTSDYPQPFSTIALLNSRYYLLSLSIWLLLATYEPRDDFFFSATRLFAEDGVFTKNKKSKQLRKRKYFIFEFDNKKTSIYYISLV